MSHTLLRPMLLAMVLALVPGAARATVSVYVSPERLAQSATLIVQATVRATASGFDPQSAGISTYVTLDIERVLRGPADLEQLVLREPGGRYEDLVLEIDAVPHYLPGERVLAYLEPGPDGALRTSQMFFGKYRILTDSRGRDTYAVRDLDGRGRILARPEPQEEWRTLADLVGLRAALPEPRAARSWVARPPEFERLAWDRSGERAPQPATASPANQALFTAPGQGPSGPPPDPLFVPLQSWALARFVEADSGTPVSLNVEPDRDPLGDAVQAVEQIELAMAAWTNVPEGRVTVAPGNLDFDYTGTHASSPAAVFSNLNIVLFGDPYEQISDPIGCAGVLAIGGYWRSVSPTSTVNGKSFYSAMQLHVIFNDGFECFLGVADDLAEVAAHEIGHGLGFGHSTAPDAIMRSVAYGDRGPRLGDDDRDALHCHYPHALNLVAPDGGEAWEAGSTHSIVWTASAENGPDPGTLDLEYSKDGGASWLSLAGGIPNVGTHSWTVPDSPSNAALVRIVRRHRGNHVPAGYPTACSGDVSQATFSITALSTPGVVPDGSNGAALRVGKTPTGALQVTWGAVVSGAADDYAVYSGSLAALRSGIWDASPVTCSAGVDLNEEVEIAGSVYLLVSALAGNLEGSLGSASSGVPYPTPQTNCAALGGSSAANPELNRPRSYAPRAPGTGRGARPARSWSP